MKYGESTFDILYLIFAIVSGVLLLCKARNRNERMMGLAALILGCGDAFHLIPRVLNYFVTGVDFTAALGVGKLVTSLTMTVFYVLMYYIALGYWRRPEDKRLTCAVWVLTAARAILCLFPQNGWLTNDSTMLWGIIRNVPFVLLGALIVAQYCRESKTPSRFRWVWLLVTLSFLFYLPVAVGAGIIPILGMLMLPKTICYIWLIVLFHGAVLKDAAR